MAPIDRTGRDRGFTRAQPAYTSFDFGDYKGVLGLFSAEKFCHPNLYQFKTQKVTSGAMLDAKNGAVWLFIKDGSNYNQTEIGNFGRILTNRGLLSSESDWKSPFENGKPNYKIRDQLFVHGKKIFYYYPQNNKLYHFDLFDCKIRSTRDTHCLKIFETKIPVRKRGFFINFR